MLGQRTLIFLQFFEFFSEILCDCISDSRDQNKKNSGIIALKIHKLSSLQALKFSAWLNKIGIKIHVFLIIIKKIDYEIRIKFNSAIQTKKIQPITQRPAGTRFGCGTFPKLRPQV